MPIISFDKKKDFIFSHYTSDHYYNWLKITVFNINGIVMDSHNLLSQVFLEKAYHTCYIPETEYTENVHGMYRIDKISETDYNQISAHESKNAFNDWLLSYEKVDHEDTEEEGNKEEITSQFEDEKIMNILHSEIYPLLEGDKECYLFNEEKGIFAEDWMEGFHHHRIDFLIIDRSNNKIYNIFGADD